MAPSSEKIKDVNSMDDEVTSQANDSVEELPTHSAPIQSLTESQDIRDLNSPVALFSEYMEVEHSGSENIPTQGRDVLRELPWELWLIVASFLPPSTARNFALSCRNTFNIMGHESQAALQRPENYRERLRFLEALDIHFPGHLLCLACGVYHKRRDTFAVPYAIHQLFDRSMPGPVQYPGSPHQGCPADAEEGVTFQLMPRDFFNWTTMHLIAREARLGSEYGQCGIESVMFAHILNKIDEAPWRHVREIRVIEGKVVAKIQSFCAVNGPSLVLASLQNFSQHRFADCRHCSISYTIRERCRIELFRFRNHRMAFPLFESEPEPAFEGGCRICPTEWSVSVVALSDLRPQSLLDFAKGGHVATEVIRVTRWICFGECKASEPEIWDRLNPTRAGYTYAWNRLETSAQLRSIMEVWPENDNSNRFEGYHDDLKTCEVYED